MTASPLSRQCQVMCRHQQAGDRRSSDHALPPCVMLSDVYKAQHHNSDKLPQWIYVSVTTIINQRVNRSINQHTRCVVLRVELGWYYEPTIWTPVCLLPSAPLLPAQTSQHILSAEDIPAVRTGRLSSWALAHILVIMAALCNRGAIIFLPCNFYLLSIFYLLSFFSSPNLSGRTLDVYHTSTHGLASVQI